MATVPATNAALKAAGLPYEIVRGRGYFWFAAMNDAASTGIPSLYTVTLAFETVPGIVEYVRTEHEKWKASLMPTDRFQKEKL